MTGWCPDVGDWVAVRGWPTVQLMQVTSILAYACHSWVTCGSWGDWWIHELRPATPEEIAAGQLASLGAGL